MKRCQEHRAMYMGVILTLGLVVGLGPAAKADTVTPRDKNVPYDGVVPDADLDSMAPDSASVLLIKSFDTPLPKKFTQFANGQWADLQTDPDGVGYVIFGSEYIISVAMPDNGVISARWPLCCEGNLLRPPNPGGGNRNASPRPEFHWRAKVNQGVVITTEGNLEIVQDPDEKQIAISAEIYPPDHSIGWQILGPGANFVTETHNQSGNTSTITISLKVPVPTGFDADTVILVKAYDMSNTNVEDDVTVNLKKFKRNGKCSPGSQPVYVSLVRNEQYIGWTFEGNVEDLPLLRADVSAVINLTIEEKSPAQAVPGLGASENLTYYYYDAVGDKADGTYTLREGMDFTGSQSVTGVYEGWFHGATVRLVTGGTAGVENGFVAINDNTIGTGYNGTPVAITLGITAEGGSSGWGVGGGISVNITLSEQDSISDSASPNGTHIVEESDDHGAGQQITIEKLVRVAAACYLSQQDDDEWLLVASSTLNAVPQHLVTVDLRFDPDL